MRQVYEMFRGTHVARHGAGRRPGSRDRRSSTRTCMSGLYYEALGDDRRALEHITMAAADRYAEAGGYMHTVAKIHLGILKQASAVAR